MKVKNTERKQRAEPVQLPASDVRDRLTELMNRATYKNERFVVTKAGKPFAAIIGLEDLQALLDAAA